MVARLLVLLMLPSMLLGCTATPDVRVDSLDKVSDGPSAGEYVLKLDIRNPTDLPMVLDRWTYEVSTNLGTWNNVWIASRTLPARSMTFDSIPVVIRHGGDVDPLTRWSVKANLRYLLPGQMAQTLFDLGIIQPNVDFSASGDATPIGVEAPAVNSR